MKNYQKKVCGSFIQYLSYYNFVGIYSKVIYQMVQLEAGTFTDLGSMENSSENGDSEKM